MQCDFCGLRGATREHTLPDAMGLDTVVGVSCADHAACTERQQLAQALTAPEPWHTMQEEVRNFLTLV